LLDSLIDYADIAEHFKLVLEVEAVLHHFQGFGAQKMRVLPPNSLTRNLQFGFL